MGVILCEFVRSVPHHITIHQDMGVIIIAHRNDIMIEVRIAMDIHHIVLHQVIIDTVMDAVPHVIKVIIAMIEDQYQDIVHRIEEVHPKT